ncbi:hypothetical protein [Myroides phaeus]|uniref:Lipocalin-like domain-containing protein n=1 Tax=Myroides phaeus TaxID=702745 RepID=A0A1G8DHE8_9FLAO|nr:hypothetical protein [Myroides phaeus]MEC4117848.1 hypothetical protein [Myroides phaeus]SDH57064.1 hypothetical protein SAMN05421818_10717 [Myroides phaeus]
MKIKRLFMSLLLVGMMFSCSNDDGLPFTVADKVVETPVDEEPVVKDVLEGNWTVAALILNDMDLGLNECETQSTISFLPEGVLEEVVVNFRCEREEEKRKGTWKALGDNKYQVRADAESPNAFFNDVEYSTLIVEEEQVVLRHKIQHEGENPYTLDLVLKKEQVKE